MNTAVVPTGGHPAPVHYRRGNVAIPVPPQHLVHRPGTPDGFVLGAGCGIEHSFVLSTELPNAHPLFNDSLTSLHDFHFVTNAIRKIIKFVAHQYFRIPDDRPAASASATINVTDLVPWRRGPEPAHVVVDMRIRPVNVTDGIPGGLESDCVVSIDGQPCCTGEARLIFLLPDFYHDHRARGRAESLRDVAGEATVVRLGERPAQRRAGVVVPEAVGRTNACNVVVGRPVLIGNDGLLVDIMPDSGDPVFFGCEVDHVPGVLLIEASRQTAVLAAGELRGFTGAHCAITHWSGEFRGFAETDLPLRATATPGLTTRDPEGRPTVTVGLVFTQGQRSIGRVTVAVLQDC